MRNRRWTSAENDLLITLVERDRIAWARIATHFGRTAAACSVHYNSMRRPGKRRAIVKVDYRFGQSDQPIRSLDEIAASSNSAPKPELAEERDRRLSARTSRDQAHLHRGDVTPCFFGDPPPGCSALDQKRAAEKRP
jgi:hypothetical protein